jgi:UDP-N-acetylglucosamine 2-epimerase
VTIRAETEWTEAVAAGWNLVAGDDPDCIATALREWTPPAARPELYGDGNAVEKVVESVCQLLRTLETPT